MFDFFDGYNEWYWARMRFFGWLETILKMCAWGILGVSFFMAGDIVASSAPVDHLSAAVAATLLTTLLVLAIYDRYLDHEIFGMIFIFFNIAAHGTVTFSLYALNNDMAGFYSETTISLWAFLMLTADLLKFFSIYIYGMRVREVPVWILYFLTIVFLASYLVILFGLNPTT